MTAVFPTANVTSPASSTTTGSSSSSSSSSSSQGLSIAGNFNTFLTLLTTQLQNQNPLDPLDTNQFTQQLVMFAQVEQQMKSNDQLSTLVSLQQTAQTTQALNYVGRTVVVNGATSALANGSATWTLNSAKPATGSLTITNSSGQQVYSGTLALNSGSQSYTWNGTNNSGVQEPDGNYTISVSAADASKQPVTVSTQAQGTIDSIDMTQTPPEMSVNGQNYPLTSIQRILN